MRISAFDAGVLVMATGVGGFVVSRRSSSRRGARAVSAGTIDRITRVEAHDIRELDEQRS